MDPYIFIIIACVAIIVSHMFNLLAKATNIPSVFMLIVLGLAMHQVIAYYGSYTPGPLVSQALNILGISGLIMIVLEAALDLKLTPDRMGMIVRSFFVALFTMLITAVGITFLIQYYTGAELYKCMVYAIPLSIVSSAIVLPSVANLQKDVKEFLIYEATFSDILGIMLFYFLIEDHGGSTSVDMAFGLISNVVLTIIVSVVAGMALLWVFQRIKTKVKFFLLIATLMLLYAVGKKLHLSSLLIILIFGLMVSNQSFIFRGRLARMMGTWSMKNIESELHLVTAETAFVVRTFFFIVFGLTIDVMRLMDIDVILLGAALIGILYIVRLAVATSFKVKGLRTITLVAPRGLITVLLAYNIPEALHIPGRDGSLLLVVILTSSLIVMLGLLMNGKNHDLSAVEPDPDTFLDAPEEGNGHASI
ncbi:MAG: cation:proton antiporter [Flavobacteriales bacterium]|nr:cation:proton antiporter [Flavobacteriales bacterium]